MISSVVSDCQVLHEHHLPLVCCCAQHGHKTISAAGEAWQGSLQEAAAETWHHAQEGTASNVLPETWPHAQEERSSNVLNSRRGPLGATLYCPRYPSRQDLPGDSQVTG